MSSANAKLVLLFIALIAAVEGQFNSGENISGFFRGGGFNSIEFNGRDDDFSFENRNNFNSFGGNSFSNSDENSFSNNDFDDSGEGRFRVVSGLNPGFNVGNPGLVGGNPGLVLGHPWIASRNPVLVGRLPVFAGRNPGFGGNPATIPGNYGRGPVISNTNSGYNRPNNFVIIPGEGGNVRGGGYGIPADTNRGYRAGGLSIFEIPTAQRYGGPRTRIRQAYLVGSVLGERISASVLRDLARFRSTGSGSYAGSRGSNFVIPNRGFNIGYNIRY